MSPEERMSTGLMAVATGVVIFLISDAAMNPAGQLLGAALFFAGAGMCTWCLWEIK